MIATTSAFDATVNRPLTVGSLWNSRSYKVTRDLGAPQHAISYFEANIQDHFFELLKAIDAAQSFAFNAPWLPTLKALVRAQNVDNRG